MDQGPLVTEQIEAGNEFLREFDKFRPVRVAFWLKESDVGNWYLYVASDQINDSNFGVAYGEVIEVGDVFRDPNFDIYQVKVIGTDDPLAKAVMEQRQRYPGQKPIWVRNKSMGGLMVELMYIYPPLPAAQPR